MAYESNLIINYYVSDQEDVGQLVFEGQWVISLSVRNLQGLPNLEGF